MRFICILLLPFCLCSQAQRLRDHGIEIGVFSTGEKNSIADVPGVLVGHTTLVTGDSVRTGVTAILPHSGNIFQQKVPAAIHIGNGFGKLAGYSQVEELGNIETPIVLTNTLSVATAVDALVSHSLALPGNEEVRSVNAIVGETNDGFLNDIRGRHVTEEHILKAISSASTDVAEGNVGAGTGTICFGFKGGIGTSSRVLPKELGGYTVGVLVQSNFGGNLEIAGVPIGKELDKYPFKKALESADGSCMIVLVTDAPLSSRNLERIAKRAMFGLAKTGGIGSNGSGDYVIAASNAKQNLIPHQSESPMNPGSFLRNDQMSPLFMATIEATEEAILNSLFAGKTTVGMNGTVERLPISEVLEIMKNYGRVD